MDLKNKKILITGANGGIASKLISLLDKEGAQCVLTSHSKPEVTSHDFYECDFTRNEDVMSFVKDIKNKYSTLDAIVNAAGIGIYKGIDEISMQEWESTLSVNLTTPFVITKELLSLVKESDLSLVLNIGSGTGITPMKNRIAYVTSKFAMRGMTLSLAEEYKNKKPHFCLITLGSTLTDFGPLSLSEKEEKRANGKAYFTPDWVANKLLQIIKDEKRDIEYTLFPTDPHIG